MSNLLSPFTGTKSRASLTPWCRPARPRAQSQVFLNSTEETPTSRLPSLSIYLCCPVEARPNPSFLLLVSHISEQTELKGKPPHPLRTVLGSVIYQIPTFLDKSGASYSQRPSRQPRNSKALRDYTTLVLGARKIRGPRRKNPIIAEDILRADSAHHSPTGAFSSPPNRAHFQSSIHTE